LDGAGGPQSTKRGKLLASIVDITACSERLRTELAGYEQAMGVIATRLDAGEPAVDASRGTPIPARRRQVTETIEEFEAARHRLRLALMAVGREEGASISDVGRVLGISRQLASRLAAEADAAGL
jgi:hypothetical protein